MSCQVFVCSTKNTRSASTVFSWSLLPPIELNLYCKRTEAHISTCVYLTETKIELFDLKHYHECSQLAHLSYLYGSDHLKILILDKVLLSKSEKQCLSDDFHPQPPVFSLDTPTSDSCQFC